MTTEAQNRATKKYQSKVYDRVMVLLPKGTADRIRATGKPVSGFAAAATIAALEMQQGAPERTEPASGSAADTEIARTPERSSGPENGPEKITLEVGPEIMQELRTYGNPDEIAAEALRCIIEEYRAGLR